MYPIYASWLGSQIKKSSNIQEGTLLISFDIDNSQDNEAAELLLPLLKKHHISATWASIGMWLKTYPSLYEKILNDGHEIINHSWSHPDNIQLRPVDLRKFNQLSGDEVTDEIVQAHNCCLELFGYQMRGFRQPHFRYHPQASLALKKLNYLYTSNQLGLYSNFFGSPFIDDNNLLEIPLSPLPRKPERIIETYRLFRMPDGLYENEEQFYNDFRNLIFFTKHYKLVSVIYLDPCDVIKLSLPVFDDYLSFLAGENISTLTFMQLYEHIKLARINKKRDA